MEPSVFLRLPAQHTQPRLHAILEVLMDFAFSLHPQQQELLQELEHALQWLLAHRQMEIKLPVLLLRIDVLGLQLPLQESQQQHAPLIPAPLINHPMEFVEISRTGVRLYNKFAQ
jgi:hypothetical protein